MTNQSQKSGVVSGLGAMIGAFLALALGLQLGWGAWGLVATILPCSVAGWIAADWRGFLAARRQAWQEAVHARLPVAYHRFRKWWKKQVIEYGRATGTWALSLMIITWIMVLIVTLLILPGTRPLKEIWLEAIITCLVLSCVAVVIAFLHTDDTVWLLANKLSHKAGYGYHPRRDEIPAAAQLRIEAQARAEARLGYVRILKYYNPISLPFLVLGKILGSIPEALPRLPKIANWCFWASLDLVRFTYLYANSDIRRIAFSSIALGMVAGFSTGYWLEQVLTGTVVGGAVGYGLGVLQHKVIYQSLAQRGLITIR